MSPSGPRQPPDRAAILAGLDGVEFVREVFVLDEAGSTNDEIRLRSRQGAAEGTVVVADRQTGGRGRLGRVWHSPPGLGLYLSVLLRPDGPVHDAPRWTLAAAVAACGACREAADADVRIKWPNDIVAGGRKLAGVLAELRSAGGVPLDLVLGFGINVHHAAADFSGELSARATSLHLLGARGILERETLAVGLLRRLGETAGRLRGGRWDEVASRWEALADGARGRRVRVRRPAGEFIGVTRGLDGDGGLLLERADGSIVAVRMADTITPLE